MNRPGQQSRLCTNCLISAINSAVWGAMIAYMQKQYVCASAEDLECGSSLPLCFSGSLLPVDWSSALAIWIATVTASKLAMQKRRQALYHVVQGKPPHSKRFAASHPS